MEAESSISLWGMLGVVAAIVGALYAALGFHYPTVKAELAEDPDYRREKAKALKHPAVWRLYGEYLARGLGWLERYMGRPWSARAFSVCFVLALAYSLLFLLVAWAFFGGPGSVGATVLLPDLPPLWRVAVAAVTVASGGILFWVIRKTNEINARCGARSAWLVHRIRPDAPAWLGYLLYRGFGALLTASIVGVTLLGSGSSVAVVAAAAIAAAVALTGGVIGAAVFAVVIALITAGPGPAALAPALAAAGFGAAAVAGAVTAALAAALAAAGFGATAVVGAGAVTAVGAGALLFYMLLVPGTDLSSTGVVAIVLFFFVLPFLNTCWDWLSWWISRALGEDQVASIRSAAPWLRKVWTSARHMVIDLVAAVAFLVALAFTLTEPPLVLDGFLCETAQRPWTAGLWATLMLLSTLLPTALHLGAVLASPSVFLFLPRERWHIIALELEQDSPPPRALRAATRHFAIVRPLIYAGAFGVACLLLYGLWRLFHLAERVRFLLLTVATRDAEFARSCLAGAGGIAG